MVSLPAGALPALSIGLGVVGGALAAGLGVYVLRAQPARDVNRRLGALLIGEGVVHSLILTQLDGLTAGPLKALAALHLAAVTALPFLYLRFLATLRTPLVGFLRSRAVASFLVAYPLLAAPVSVLLLLASPVSRSGPPGGLVFYYSASVGLLGLVSLLGLGLPSPSSGGAFPGPSGRERPVMRWPSACGTRSSSSWPSMYSFSTWVRRGTSGRPSPPFSSRRFSPRVSCGRNSSTSI